MYAIWKTAQHYSEPHSLPLAKANDLQTLLNHADKLPKHDKRSQFIAKWADGQWRAYDLFKGGKLQNSRNLPRYERTRRGELKWSHPSRDYEDLKPSDHPSKTKELG